MAKFFANFAMAKISDLKVMDTETEVCPHYWLVNLVSLLKTEFSKLLSVLPTITEKMTKDIFTFLFSELTSYQPLNRVLEKTRKGV